MSPGPDLSAVEARRIALLAQGFPRPDGSESVGPMQLSGLLERIHVLQIDPIGTLVRSQYLPIFSRLGPYPLNLLDELAYEQHELFEYVGHEWSLLQVELHPLFRWRMHAFASDPRWMADLPTGYADAIFEEVAKSGPLTARELSSPGTRTSRFEGAPGKRALTWLTQSGRLAVVGRQGSQQVYDLVERVIPGKVLSRATPDLDDARRELLLIAASALGVATAKDLGSYFLIGSGVAGVSERTAYPASTKVPRLVADLVEAGRLENVSVEGWSQPAFLDLEAKVGTRVNAHALLSPFDSLIWNRERTERVFDFHYRSEFYTPAAKRQYGYYVLPFLHGDKLVARVDLKADRKSETLLVIGAFAEDGIDVSRTAAALTAELQKLATWLGLREVLIGTRGDLCGHL